MLELVKSQYLTFLSSRLAPKCEWEVHAGSTIGSDHYPILCKLDIDVGLSVEESHGRWIFKKADWERFMETSDLYINLIQDIDDAERNEIELRN